MSSSPPIPPNRTTEGNTENMTANNNTNNNNTNNNNNNNSKPPPPPLPRRNLPTPPTTSSTTTAAASTTTTNMIDSTTTATATSSKKIESLYEGVVIRNYHAEEDDELTVNIHDTVQVIKEFDDGWLLCQLILSRKNHHHHHSNSATTTTTSTTENNNNNNNNVASAYVRALERRKQQKTLGLVPKEHVERAEFCSSISNTKVRVPIRKGSVHVIKQKLDLEAVFNNKNQQQQQQQQAIVPPTTLSNNNSTTTSLPNSPPSTPPLTPPSSAKRDSTNNNNNNNTNETASITKISSKGNIFSSLLSKKKSLNSIQMSSAINNNTNDSNSNNNNSNNTSNISTPPPVPTNKPVRPSSMESTQQQQQKSPSSISSPRERDVNMNNLSRIVMMNPRPSSSPAAPSSSSSSQESISSPSATSSTSSVDLSLNTLMSSADIQSCSTHGDDSNSSSTCTTPMSPNDSSSSSSNTESSMSSTSLTLPDQQMQQMQQLIESHIARREGKTEQIREMQTKRKQIRMEILETEQTYVHCLTLQRNMFAKLIKMLKLVPDDVYKLLFPTSLDIIYDINVSFLDYLKKVITTMPSMAFGAEQMRTLMSKMSLESSEMTDEIKNQCLEGALKEVSMINDAGNGSSINSNSPTAAPSAPKGNFEIDPYQSQSTQLASLILHYAHTFKLYTDYINKYPIVISTLMQEKARNKKFAEFLHHQRILLQQQGERCCMLEDFLITPIQRLPRYRLLFEDLMKKTEPEHGSYETLEMAVNLITDIAKFCNDKEEEHLNQIAMATLLKRYKLKEFLQPGRRILMRFESQTDVQYMKSKGSRGECDLYLLSDAILVAKSKNSLSNKKNTLRIQLTKIGSQLDKKGTACAVQLSPPVQMKLDHQLFYSFQVVTNYVPLGSDLNSSSTSKPQKITLLWKCETTMTKAYQAIQSIQPNIGS